MPSPRIFCDVRLGPGAQFPLPEDAANHVGRALRLRAGDSLVVFDGRGGEYDAVILRIDHGRVDVKTGGFRSADREALPAIEHGRLHFAGEATSVAYPATVHGAYLSGIRAADEVP